MTQTAKPAAEHQAARTPTSAQPTRPSSSNQLTTLARAQLRSFFRDRAALFFTLFFPLVFLVVFGLLLGSDSARKTQIGVVGDGPIVQALPPEAVEIRQFDTLNAAVEEIRSGDLPAVIAQDGDTVMLRYSAGDPVRAAAVQSIVGSVISAANVAATGEPARFHADSQPVAANDFKPIQYMTPGIVSWGVAASATFGAALTLVTWRRTQLLRRIRLAPAPIWTVVGARVGVSIVLAILQAVLYIGIALTPPFGLQLSGQWWLAVPLLIVGTLAFLSIGLVIGAMAKTDEAAAAVANLVVLPMAFLSGSFLPVSTMPSWLQSVSQLFPLRHLNEGLLDVLVRGEGAPALLAPTAVLLAFTLALTFAATRLFSWDDT